MGGAFGSPNTGFEIGEIVTGDPGEIRTGYEGENSELDRRGILINLFGNNFRRPIRPGAKYFCFWRAGLSGEPEPIPEGEVYATEQIEVNANLISAIIVDTKFIDAAKELVPAPNLVVTKGDRAQVFYLLEKFIPRNAGAKSLKFLESVSRRIRIAARGQLWEGKYCLNPFCTSNEVVLLAEQRYTLDALKPITQAATKVAQSESGVRSAGIARQKSLDAICKVIRELYEAGEKITQVKVSQRTDLSIITVKRCWKDDRVKKDLEALKG